MSAPLAALALAAAFALMSGRRRRLRARLSPTRLSAAGPESSLDRATRRLRARVRRRRVIGDRQAEAIEIVFALAAELRAGQPPGRALARVAECAPSLRSPLVGASMAVESGAPPSGELRRIGALPGCDGLLAVAAAWAVTESAGGAVAEVLDRLGEVLEADRQSRAALDAALAAPRATMALLAGLPVLGVVLGQSLGARPLHLLVGRPVGWMLLAAGVTLDLLGVAWTRLLVRRALR